MHKLYREEALDDKFLNIFTKYGTQYLQELSPVYLLSPETLEIFLKYFKKKI